MCDALGLASFIVTGVVVAVEVGATPISLWGPVAATLTGAGSGILRGIARADKDNPALKRTFYSQVVMIWGFVFSVFIRDPAVRGGLRLAQPEIQWAEAYGGRAGAGRRDARPAAA